MMTNEKYVKCKRFPFKKALTVLVFLMVLVLIPIFSIPMSYAANKNPGDLSQPEFSQSDKKYNGEAPDPSAREEIAKDGLTDVEKKLSTRILQLTEEKYLPAGITQSELINQMEKQNQIVTVPIENGTNGKASGFNVHVYIKTRKGLGFGSISHYAQIENQDAENGLAAAWVDLYSIKSIAELEEVKSISEVLSPVVYSGSRMSEGDSVLNTDLFRFHTGVDGTGVKVGIISDGVDNWTTARDSGDLPAGVTVLSNTVGGNEGTAMLEIVYDLAPGADLYFHDCGDNIIAFNSAIDDLVSVGCNIICDDIGWIAQPFFEDGTIAQHVTSVLDLNDIVYVSSAGNSGYSSSGGHYQGTFYDAGNNWHDFSNGSEPTTDLYAYLPSGGQITVVLQWNDTFGSSGNDYDLLLYDTNDYSTPIWGSTNTQDGDDDPLEGFIYTNDTGSAMTVAIGVSKYNGAAKTLEVYTYCKNGTSMYSNNIVSADSIFGHAAVPGIISCGAVHFDEPTTIENFSSLGPVTMLTGTRNKPDICGVDGVTITGAGGFSVPFYGTSAAAPHIAAVAALLQSRFPTNTPEQIKELITSNGVDLGATGYDNTFGYGRADVMPDVTFNSMGGTAISTQTIPIGDKPTEPSDPTRDSYVFEGWYSSSYPHDCNNWDFDNDTVMQDTTLYAKWTDPSLDTPYIDPISTSQSAISVSWTAVPDADGYEVWYATQKFGVYSLKYISDSGAAGSWTRYGLTTNKTYYFMVRAFKTVNGVSVYGTDSTIQSTAPGRPSMSVTATSPISAVVSWYTVDGSDGYEVWRGTQKSGTYSLKCDAPASADSWININLTTGKAYYYKVRAYRLIGGVKTYSQFSSINSVVTSADHIPGAPYVDPISTSYSAIMATWTQVPGATGYEVWYATNKYGTYSLKYTSNSGDAGSWTRYGLTTDKTYYFKVRALQNVNGEIYYGPYSTIQSTAPGRPSMSVKRASSTSATITWISIDGSEGYEVWRGTQKFGTYSLKYISPSSTSSWTNGGLTTGKAYYYKVRSFRMVDGVKVYSQFSSINSVVP